MEQKLTQGQKFALIKLCEQFSSDFGRDGRLFLLSALLNKPVTSVNDLTVGGWRTNRNQAYPDWANKNWEVGPAFAAKARRIVAQYQVEVLGQIQMFQDGVCRH